MARSSASRPGTPTGSRRCEVGAGPPSSRSRWSGGDTDGCWRPLRPVGRGKRVRSRSYVRWVRAPKLIVSLDDLRAAWPQLAGSAVVAVDLSDAGVDLSVADVEGAMFLGCSLPPGAEETLASRGAATLSAIPGVSFEVYRCELYTPDELTAGHQAGLEATVDALITDWFESSSSAALTDLVVRALHDATIDAAVARFVLGRRVVGVMGGHALARDAVFFREVARLGRCLTREGFTVATGGGPGVMEAANLGAWCAPMDDTVLDLALAVLSAAPIYGDDPAAYVGRALDVRERWPGGGVSLGVPTWVYAQEPTGGFASHIAKYFTNSIREDGLLAIARSGVVYAPGGAGTEQEIFTDTAQNSLTLYGVRSPMVFFGSQFFERDRAELLAAARRQADEFGWGDLVAVRDDPAEVVAFIASHDPDRAGASTVERRRRHRGPR